MSVVQMSKKEKLGVVHVPKNIRQIYSDHSLTEFQLNWCLSHKATSSDNRNGMNPELIINVNLDCKSYKYGLLLRSNKKSITVLHQRLFLYIPALLTSTGFKESANSIIIITSFNTEAADLPSAKYWPKVWPNSTNVRDDYKSLCVENDIYDTNQYFGKERHKR